ncbi:D-alanyl-D-alanine carboxypeptidase [Synechococcus sp. Nb3U1]|uniref:D-alanyl-D-alanine carboxypeptidase n=1 Tax=Synechococcus sp. Nb3U1 TaxID=1914529 RepID=UPI001F3E08CD|nr:D-alanyl-D-alanine carboxypeptidase [Synechococcus sp. Nb3U1]MCF2971547.1 D-alanyl-D-alanine carboxypeptidase [Synechococcus sp. Nb3U1]
MPPIPQWLRSCRRSFWAGIPLAFSLALGACWTNRTGSEVPPLTQAVQAGSPTSAQNPFPPIPTPPPPLPSPTGTPGVPPWWPRSQTQVWEYSPYAVVLSGFLQGLAAQGGSLSQQGILLWTAEGELLAEHLLDQPLPVGALDQLAISLMAIETWGYEHRFETRFYTTGHLLGHRLTGDLIVVGGGDPYFTEANVEALARHLRNFNIRQIDGDVKVLPSFHLVGQTDPLASGRRLAELLADPEHPHTVSISGSVSTLADLPAEARFLASYTSLRLGSLLQILNGSNDRAMAETLLAELGGKPALLEYLQHRLVAHPISYMDAAMTLGEEDIRLGKADQALQLSPRAFAHLWEYLIDFTAGDPTRILPMAGIGHSTLRVRTLPLGTSAQVGSAEDRLMVMGQLSDGTNFVLLNQGPDLGLLRQQQDQFLQDVLVINEPSHR